MQVPIRVVFDGLERSRALEEACARAAAKLEQFHDHITSCRVNLSRPHRRHVRGNPLEIRVHVQVPTGEVVTRATTLETAEPRALAAALRRAFHAARRRIQDLVQRQRGAIKTHATTRARRAPFIERRPRTETLARAAARRR